LKAARIATRGSALALWQANHMREGLERSCGMDSEIVVVKTSGDRATNASLERIGIKGVFTKELEDALINGRADLAVHSMKDVPTDFSAVCSVAILFRREDPRDALVSRHGEKLDQLAHGARIGTSSLRRASQLRLYRPDLQITEIRGNVDTRLRKLASGVCDAVVLAKAGLDRLGLSSQITEVLSPEIVLPAVGQGALGVEFLKPRKVDFPFLDSLEDRETVLAVEAERALLAELQGGCRLPLGAWARFENGKFTVDACVLSADGAQCIRRRRVGECGSGNMAVSIGRELGKELLAEGADRLLRLAGRSVVNG
jgi:hydroxymethylbilane synthase